MDIFLIIFSVVFGVSTITNVVVERKKRALQTKLTADLTKEAAKAGTTIETELKKMEGRIVNALLPIKEATPVGGSTKVYAFILQRGHETRLYMHVAPTYELMLEHCTRENGNGWLVVAHAWVEVKNQAAPIPYDLMPLPPMATIEELMRAANVEPLAKPIAPQVPQKEQNVAIYVANLEYARDKFANPAQREAIDGIIDSIKKMYGKSTSAGN